MGYVKARAATKLKYRDMTLNGYAYEVWEIVRKKIVDDDEIDIRLIIQLITDQRKLAISNAINKGNKAPDGSDSSSGSGYDGGWDSYVQSMSLDLSLVTCPPEDNPCVEQAKLWKSNTEFPETLSLGRRPAIIRVAPCSGDCVIKGPILFASHDRARFVGNGRFNNNQIVGYIRDDHFWIMTKDTLVDPFTVCIDAIFEDPTKVPGFDPDTDEFPVGKNWPYMMANIIKYLDNKIKSTQDRINDATNE